MTARVRALLEMLHDGVGKPHLGYVLSDDGRESVSYNAIKCQHERVVRRLKLPKFRLYDLRHTFLTRLGEAGGRFLHDSKNGGAFEHSRESALRTSDRGAGRRRGIPVRRVQSAQDRGTESQAEGFLAWSHKSPHTHFEESR